MKLACILAAAALHVACADTNLVTFTNSAGRVYRDVRITGHDATGFFCWATNGSGSKVLFTEAPEFAAARFQFDPTRVVARTGSEAEGARKYREWYARESARLMAEQIKQQDYLKRRTKLLNETTTVRGRVVQRHAGRIILHVDRLSPLRYFVAVINHPNYDGLRSNMDIAFVARLAGNFDYVNTAGDPVSVVQFDAAPPAEFAADKVVKEWFANPQ